MNTVSGYANVTGEPGYGDMVDDAGRDHLRLVPWLPNNGRW